MKILILGTSNSLLKRGWVDGLRTALPNAVIDNRSIGGSPGTQYSCEIRQDFTAFDVVFFDSVPNDEVFGDHIGDEYFVNRIYYELLATISAQSRLILIGFCLREHLEIASATYEKRQRMARICGAQFIGFRELVKTFGRTVMGEEEELYETDAHPKQKFQKLIGGEIGYLLESWLRQAYDRPGYLNDFSKNFAYVSCESLSWEKRLRRANSAFDVPFIRMEAGDHLHFPVGRCIGVYLNMFNTRAFVEFTGPDGDRAKEYLFKMEDSKFEIRFMPVKNGHISSGIKILSDRLPFERSAYSTFGDWPNLRRPAVAEFWKFGFWNGEMGEIPAGEDFDAFSLHRQIQDRLEVRLKLPAQTKPSAAKVALSTAAQMVADGMSCFEEKDFEQADRLFEQAWLLDDQALTLKRDVAEAWLREGFPHHAIKVLRGVVQISPTASDLQRLGRAMLKSSHPEEAIDVLKKSLSLEPSATRHALLGSAFLLMERHEESMAEHKRALDSEPLRFDSLREIGASLIRLHRPAEAMVYLQRLIIINKKDATAYLLLARASQMVKDFKAAAAAIESGLTISSTHAGLLAEKLKLQHIQSKNKTHTDAT